MKLNLKYLVLPLSIMVCISENYSNAMSLHEEEEEINTTNNINEIITNNNTQLNITNQNNVNSNNQMLGKKLKRDKNKKDNINTTTQDNNIEVEENIINNNVIHDDSYQHILDENYNKEYYDDVCNKCIEYITKHKPQYKTFIESSFIVFNKLIEMVKEKYRIMDCIYYDYDQHNGINIDDVKEMRQIDERNRKNKTRNIAKLSDSFEFNSNDLLQKLKVQGNKLLNNNLQQLNNYINEVKKMKKQYLIIDNNYITNLLNKLRTQCIIKLTDSINNGEDYNKQIDIIKNIESIITIIMQHYRYKHDCEGFPDYEYYTLKNEVDLLDKIYYKGSKLENRFNNLHNKIISTIEDMMNNNNSNNTFVKIYTKNLNKLLDKFSNKTDKLFKFLQTDTEKFTEFNKIISAFKNTEQLTAKQYYKYIIDMLTILKNITDNQIQNRLNNNFTQVIFNNNEEYEDIITYYLSIAYLLLECENNENTNNSKCRNTLIDVILRFTMYYQINFDFSTRYGNTKDMLDILRVPQNQYIYFNDYFYKYLHKYDKQYDIRKDHIIKLLQNRMIQTLDNSDGSFNNMQWYEQLLYNMVYTLVVLEHYGCGIFYPIDEIIDSPNVNINHTIDKCDFEPILRQFICVICNNIPDAKFPCEAAFFLYYKTMINKLDKIIKKSIFDGLVKLNSNKYNNQETHDRVQNLNIINDFDIIRTFRKEYKNENTSIWYDTAMRLFSNTEDFLASSNIETIVNNVKNNTTLGNNQNNNTQNTFDNLFLFIIMIYNDNIINEQDLTELLDVLIDMIKNNTTFPHSVNNITQINLDGFINNVGKTENKQVLHSLLYLSLYSLIAWYQDVLSNNNDNENTKSNKITTFINNYILGGKDKNKETNLQQKNYNGYMKIINAILKQLINIKCKNIFDKYKDNDQSMQNKKKLYTDCVRGVYDLFSFVNIASHKILYKQYGIHANNQRVFINHTIGHMSNSDLLIRFYNTFQIGAKFCNSCAEIFTEQKNKLLKEQEEKISEEKNKNISETQQQENINTIEEYFGEKINNYEQLRKNICDFLYQNDLRKLFSFMVGSNREETSLNANEFKNKPYEGTQNQNTNEREYRTDIPNILPRLPANQHNDITKFL